MVTVILLTDNSINFQSQWLILTSKSYCQLGRQDVSEWGQTLGLIKSGYKDGFFFFLMAEDGRESLCMSYAIISTAFTLGALGLYCNYCEVQEPYPKMLFNGGGIKIKLIDRIKQLTSCFQLSQLREAIYYINTNNSALPCLSHTRRYTLDLGVQGGNQWYCSRA